MNRSKISGLFGSSTIVLTTLLLLSGLAGPVSGETIMISSGQASIGSADPVFTFLAGPPAAPLSALPFTPADFAAALSGPPAIVVAPYGSFWLASLACDPSAQWISVDVNRGPASILFADGFSVHTCCIGNAKLTFCWSADDYLGDALAGGPNPDGVYLNGVSVGPISGGSYATENSVQVDVTSLIHCGANTLHVYDRDGAAVVTGAMFSARLDIVECAVPARPSTWGSVKALYR